MEWARETAVVTGGTEGIGKALVEELCRRGPAVAFCARGGEKAAALAGQLTERGRRVLGAACDVRDEAQVSRFAQEAMRAHGPPTILVNNAGIARFVPVAEMSVADWDTTMETNLRGMFLVTRAFLPAMLDQRRGVIVNVASLAGRNPVANGAAYAASKHGVLGFSKSLMLEVRKHGLRVLAVCPGSVDTPFFDKSGGGHDPDRSRILAASDVAQIICDAVALPERAMVSELDIRPTNP
jgi:3-oxoacyl-[acyl-carrier protein] reductase